MFTENDHGADEPTVTPEELAKVDIEEFKIDPATATPEQVAAIIQKGKTLNVQRHKWRDKALTAPPPVAPPSPSNNEPPAPSETDGLKSTVDKLVQSEEKRTFGHVRHYSPEEVDHIFSYAKGVGRKPEDVLDDPFVKSGIVAVRNVARNGSATPGPSSRLPAVEGKTFDKLSTDERRQHWGRITGAKQ